LGKYFINNMVNPLKLYITDPSTPPWDGIPRIDTFFTDYLGAENSHYTRRTARMWFCGAVRRALNAGVKFDLIPVLSGKPGNGKTEVVIALGGRWSLDKLSNIAGVKAMEDISGKWIAVLDEMAYKSGATNEDAKSFLTSRKDTRRVPYGKYTQDFPRTCVFMATTNKKSFLSDPTGDRRFIPIVTDVVPHTKDYQDLTPDAVLQLWKEAKVMSDAGEKTWINPKDEDWDLFFGKQEEHREISQVETEILNFLDTKIPENWSTTTLDVRMAFYTGGAQDSPSLVSRTAVCPREILLEGFRLDTTKWSGTRTAEIREVMDNLHGWEKVQGKPRKFGIHGLANPWYKKVT
jgi:predicted P-loop ATPase